MLDQLLPEIIKLVSEKTLNAIKTEGAAAAYKGIYSALPFPVRMLVKEDNFINFCISNQHKILGEAPKKQRKTKKAASKIQGKTTGKRPTPSSKLKRS